MELRGQRILIIESEVVFGPQLQGALEGAGAETMVVRDPYSPTGAARIAQFDVCAALVNSAYDSIVEAMTVPVVIYGPNQPIPARVDAVVAELKRTLAAPGA